MFTGLVRAIGRIERAVATENGKRLVVRYPVGTLGPVALGDSICVSGVCLTALEPNAGSFAADVSGETLQRTLLGSLAAGDGVNLEPSLTPSTLLGGHLVTGHIDATGRVLAFDGERWTFALPHDLAQFVAVKGSIAVNGVSLTVNSVADDRFGVTLIPHTLMHTTFGEIQSGAIVNLEVDLVARYVARLLNRS